MSNYLSVTLAYADSITSLFFVSVCIVISYYVAAICMLKFGFIKRPSNVTSSVCNTIEFWERINRVLCK